MDPPAPCVDIARKQEARREIDTPVHQACVSASRCWRRYLSGGNQTSATQCEGVLKTVLPRVDSVWARIRTAEVTEFVDRASDEEVLRALDAVYALAKCDRWPLPERSDSRSAARMTSTRRYFERRAEAFDRLYTRQSAVTRSCVSGLGAAGTLRRASWHATKPPACSMSGAGPASG